MPNDYDATYFEDAEQLGELLTDTRATDTRTVSDAADARQIIEEFRNNDVGTPWNGLDRGVVADRLLEIVDDSRNIRQARLNLCGPAALVCMWGGRDPVAFATFATALYDNGSSSIGSMSVAPSDELLQQDYTNLPSDPGTAGADWMVLSAIRNTAQPFWQSSWVGDPEQEFAALTRPEELAEWLRATGIYGNVWDGGNWVTPAGIPQATGIVHAEGRDVALLLHTNLLHAARTSARPIDSQFLLDLFPNHYVVGLNDITQAVMDGPADASGNPAYYKDDVLLSIWSWGENSFDLAVPQQAFVDNYYGAVVADLA